jgi:hypothetical protein
MITRLTEKVSKAQAFRVLVLAQALLKQLSLSLSHTRTHTHTSFLKLCTPSSYWSNTEKVGIGYYALTARTTLNFVCFGVIFTSRAPSSLSSLTKEFLHPRFETLKGCILRYLCLTTMTIYITKRHK